MSSDENDQTPGMDNMAVTKEAKSEEPSALVIIVTSHDGEKVAMEAFKDGTHRHLAKPLNMSELTTTIDAYLSRKRADSKNQANIRIGTDGPAQPEMPHTGVTLRQYNQILQAVRFINENCGSDIGRSVAAQEAGMSHAHFSRIFKKVMGMSYQVYINHQRINKAEDLLLTSIKSVSDIATSLGFADATAFGRIFKKVTGHTPSSFRNQRQKDFLAKKARKAECTSLKAEK
jgi:two-component system response regulator YesN